MAKKSKRLLSAALAALMCAGSMGLSAFAGGGETEAAAEATFPISKTANGLDENDQTDVTLTVPGTIEGYIDVVFILGGGMPENMETIESAINVFKPAMESGKATVRMGLISLEKGDEIILDLNSDEAVLDPDTYVDFVTKKFESIKDLPTGSTNLHSQLVEAKKMLAAEKDAKPENKYLFVMATGRTYWYDNEQGDATTIITKDTDTKTNETKYFWGIKAYQALRGRNNNLYLIPSQYKDNFDEYWEDVEGWVTEDIANGDKYAYTVVGSNDNDNWYGAWYAEHNGNSIKFNGSTHGNELLNITPENFVTTGVIDGVTWGVGVQNALNYERAQYEAAQVYEELVASGYNCYAICSEQPHYQNNTDRDCLKYFSHTGTYTAMVGHSFMDYLARLGGQDAAPVVWEFMRDENGDAVFSEGYQGNWKYAKTVLNENFFESVRDDMLYTTSIGSTVEDFIGKNENGNFEFIENAEYITLKVGGVDYITTMTKNTEEGSKYEFAAKEGAEPTFWLDYYYGDGETTEKFVWTFGENVSLERLATLTYKLQLKDKVEEVEEKTTFTVPTNNSATLYPVDSDGNEGEPQVFPVPEVEYIVTPVVPYDVDIVLALGAGIAKYDNDYVSTDGTAYTNTYDSIVTLVEPLVNQGINVKLGLVAVEHYTEKAMDLTVLTKENYKTDIQNGLEKIQNMPAGPTNLEGVIAEAHAMLTAESEENVPAENKFFHVIATGRTYCFDDAEGNPATTLNSVALKGNTYYYWGHYAWQSQRGRHTSLYLVPQSYNDNWDAYWADVIAMNEADEGKYDYTFPIEDYSNPQWYNTYSAANTKDAKALGLASSRFGWIINDLTGKTLDAIGSGANPGHAMAYDRGQYEAWVAYEAMKDDGINCYALCSENTSYQNGSPYMARVGYKGDTKMQIGHSFMNFLAGGEATLLFPLLDPNTGASGVAENFFAAIDVDALVESETSEGTVEVPMMSARPSWAVSGNEENEDEDDEIFAEPVITNSDDLSTSVEGGLGENVSVTIEAIGEGELSYQWYICNAGSSSFSKSSITEPTYEVEMNESRDGRKIYCVITDEDGDKTKSETFCLSLSKNETKINVQPKSVVVSMGETATVTVEAEGDGLKYRWYFRNAGDENFAASSITEPTYEVEMTKARANREIYCVITDAYGNKVETDVVTLGVPELKLTADLADEYYFEMGEEGISIEIVAEGDGLTYKWYFCNANSSKFTRSGLNGNAYTLDVMNKTRANRQIYCVITDAYGNSVTTNTATLVVD